MDGDVDNDATLEWLAEAAVSHARAGADIVAPSDMMDGRVAAIRHSLDAHGFQKTPILAYAAKFASVFYGPFREAAESTPQFGDRRSYQMDPANGREAMHEMELDLEEGADMLMVKPAMPYLDLIRQARDRFPVPIGAYQVSGEFSMIVAAAQQRLAGSGPGDDGVADFDPARRRGYHSHVFRQRCRACAGVARLGPDSARACPLSAGRRSVRRDDRDPERQAGIFERVRGRRAGFASPVVALEVARNVNEVDSILGEAPSPDREAMRIKQYVDFGFIACYVSLYVALGDVFPVTRWRSRAAICGPGRGGSST